MSLDRIATVLREVEGLEADALGAHHLVDAVERLRSLSGHSLNGYADLVTVDAAVRGELVAELLVHETSFFRYPASFRRLAETALERAAARPGPVRVLSAACATGQEAYSAAIALLEAGLPPERTKVDAFDRSSSAIDVARAGRFERGGARGLDTERTSRWFEGSGDAWTVVPAVRALVRFETGDLLAERRPFAGTAYDAVLCRNLLIYLTEPARRRALEALRASLAPGGVLFVGHAEVLVARSGGFAPLDAPSTYACVAAPAGSAAVAAKAPRAAAAPARARTSAPESAARVAASPTAGAPPRPATASARPAGVSSPPAEEADALEEARDLADAGRLAEAVARLEAEIARGRPGADHFHLLALVHRAAGKPREADVALGRALYLDPAHVGALLLAAVAAEGRGERGTAQRLNARARAAAGGGAA